MHFYEATVDIAAPPERIWPVITNAEGFTHWDSGIERVEGTIAPGETIKLWSKVAPDRAFPLKVSGFEANRSMSWSGGMPMGLFKGVRTFLLTPTASGTSVHVREEYTGPLVGVMWRSMPDLGPSFQQFVDGLKARVEGGAA
jgi:uncharacterized protein YndB with AHSA1/START domain